MWARPEARPISGRHYDAIIVGAGLAGLSAALSLPADWHIALLFKTDWRDSASAYAQGGIAAALDPADSVAAHLADTLAAGAGHGDARRAAALLAQGPAAIAWLTAAGVPFTRTNGALHLTREGGHSRRRIVHAADHTGQTIMTTLWPQVAAHGGIHSMPGMTAVDILSSGKPGRRRCTGVLACDPVGGSLLALHAPRVVLATGGSGQLYPRSSNPASATGDGQAMAWRAGCRLIDLEFVQFHPTGLALPQRPANARYPLISEALRGEGALLRRPDGRRFMPAYDARAELAPRDIVARAIYREMQAYGLPHVALDVRHQAPDFMARHFPAINAICRTHGIDPRQAGIPVAPLAHYACGGVRTNEHGRTDLPGLYAIGECGATGLHGANRLASNSLLECVVMGLAAAGDMRNGAPHWPDRSAPPTPTEGSETPWPDAICAAAHEQLQDTMWHGAGILRHADAMARAWTEVTALRADFGRSARPAQPSNVWLALRNLLDLAALTLAAARARAYSCGAHALKD